MNKLSPRQEAACDAAKAQRRLCRDWLIYIMTASSEKTRTKADLRAEAIARFKVSKSAFNFGWMWAIKDTGMSALPPIATELMQRRELTQRAQKRTCPRPPRPTRDR
jgi:hypothetical protein